jgi:hypothetical protein
VTSIQPELWVETRVTAVVFYEEAFGATVLHRVGEGDDPSRNSARTTQRSGADEARFRDRPARLRRLEPGLIMRIPWRPPRQRPRHSRQPHAATLNAPQRGARLGPARAAHAQGKR